MIIDYKDYLKQERSTFEALYEMDGRYFGLRKGTLEILSQGRYGLLKEGFTELHSDGKTTLLVADLSTAQVIPSDEDSKLFSVSENLLGVITIG